MGYRIGLRVYGIISIAGYGPELSGSREKSSSILIGSRRGLRKDGLGLVMRSGNIFYGLSPELKMGGSGYLTKSGVVLHGLGIELLKDGIG